MDALPGDGAPQAKLFLPNEAVLRRLDTVRDTLAVLLIHFPVAWNAAARGKFFDAHDALKALGAEHNIPAQVPNDRAFTCKYQGVSCLAPRDSTLCETLAENRGSSRPCRASRPKPPISDLPMYCAAISAMPIM